MRQQINLYQPTLYQRRTPLPASTAASLLGVVCVALALGWFYRELQVKYLEDELQSAQAQQQRQADLVQILGAAQSNRGNPVDLKARAQWLRVQLTDRHRVLDLLQSGSAGTTGGFAERLAALARKRVEGVWLDHIALGGAPGVSSLAGRAVDPNLVPRYLQMLATEPALVGTRFDEFHIGEAAAVASPDGEPVGAADAQAPKKSPVATRFRASSVALPSVQAQAGSSS